MKQAQQMVREFMLAARQECPEKPTIPDLPTCDLREILIDEEVNELRIAVDNEDFVEIADALGDILVVVLGCAIAYGIDIEPIFNEIHRSNMSKFIDGYRREDGKWMKGPSYSPANLEPIIQKQLE